jgi:hypothetical protein
VRTWSFLLGEQAKKILEENLLEDFGQVNGRLASRVMSACPAATSEHGLKIAIRIITGDRHLGA